MQKQTCLKNLALALVSSLCLVSCASGPSYAEVKGKLTPPAKGQGRVFVYRTSGMGGLVSPAVKMNDVEVGTSQGGGFFYTDQPAGTHQVSITTEWKHKNTVTVAPGQNTFVQCKVTPGVLMAHIIPNQVSAAVGESEISNCKSSMEK